MVVDVVSGKDDPADALAWCSACEWNVATDLGGDVARMLCVMHVLTRHPQLYAETTGRDPEEAAHDYREILANPDVQGAI